MGEDHILSKSVYLLIFHIFIDFKSKILGHIIIVNNGDWDIELVSSDQSSWESELLVGK